MVQVRSRAALALSLFFAPTAALAQTGADAKDMARKLGMSTDQDQWFTEAYRGD